MCDQNNEESTKIMVELPQDEMLREQDETIGQLKTDIKTLLKKLPSCYYCFKPATCGCLVAGPCGSNEAPEYRNYCDNCRTGYAEDFSYADVVRRTNK